MVTQLIYCGKKYGKYSVVRPSSWSIIWSIGDRKLRYCGYHPTFNYEIVLMCEDCVVRNGLIW